jgi:hypothetical protein
MHWMVAGVRNAPRWSSSAFVPPKSPFSLLIRSVSGMTTNKAPVQTMEHSDHEEFYRYTSGRWLWDEKPRLQERYKKFNVAGLKRLAVQAAAAAGRRGDGDGGGGAGGGAQSCVSFTKLAEGGFNKVFRVVMDNGAVVIARIPHPLIGPAASKVIASEVATMAFVSF